MSVPADLDHDDYLRLQGIHKSFGATEVLRGIDLAVHRGRSTAVVGASGSGKTTLLRIIAGFERPDAGTVTIGDRQVAGPDGMLAAHRRNVGYVAQDGALFPHLTVGQNLAFGLPERRGSAARARVRELLEMVSMGPEYVGRRPHELSGGQQQRVALARALAREPQLMLLDEPFSALDAGLRVATRKAVGRTLAQAGVTSVLVTHDQAEALSFADQVAVIRRGELAQVGSPFVVYTRPADRETAEFLGEAIVLDAWLQGSLASCALGDIPIRRPARQGSVQVMLRPEQVRIAPDGPIHGVVVDVDYFGPDATVRIRLLPGPGTGSAGQAGGETISIRHWNASIARPGTELRLRVLGEGVAFAPDSAAVSGN
ncbi:ABC transporter ATP-binding protein [Tersicoccus phoenicis]|uniref:ABC-type quaternary amine transporter n=1 Tax=Tersicoccus phoenicis TaxID=554083 RepID=A0A1R1LNZ6_9MICC|nr:ABC transporter ATP-binding protein [Tersicoccus phoenicis]OMH29263.1 ABC transporter ATP-binding protein [Tersicoccus phoenicis]